MKSIHRDTNSYALHVFAAQDTFHTVSYCFLRGSHPIPDQLPGEHTGLHLMQGSTSLSFNPSAQHFAHTLYNPDYVDSVWQETTVEELKALFGINILMGLNQPPQYKLLWHQNDLIGNSGVKKTMTCRRYQKLTQYLHVSDRANEPA